MMLDVSGIFHAPTPVVAKSFVAIGSVNPSRPSDQYASHHHCRAVERKMRCWRVIRDDEPWRPHGEQERPLSRLGVRVPKTPSWVRPTNHVLFRNAETVQPLLIPKHITPSPQSKMSILYTTTARPQPASGEYALANKLIVHAFPLPTSPTDISLISIQSSSHSNTHPSSLLTLSDASMTFIIRLCCHYLTKLLRP